MLKCVIFDMDGTIGDTLPLCVAGFRKAVLKVSGKDLTDDEIYAAFGPDEYGAMASLLSQDIDEAVRLYLHYYQQMHDEYCQQPFDGIPELLAGLKRRGMRLALVTGKGAAALDITLKKFGMDGMFEAMEVGKPFGPDKPAGIKRVLHKLGLQPQQAVYVGDSPGDVDSAAEASVSTISAAWADAADAAAQQAKAPLAVCKSVQQLSDYLSAMMDDNLINATRYARQLAIPSIGEEGQRKLAQAKVLVIGAGGLGSPVLLYLCAAGIGNLGIADLDTVSESNLNRQILHGEDSLDMAKTTSAKARLHALNSETEIIEHNMKLNEDNIDGILSGYDMVVDCVDNIETRILVAKACHRLAMPVVEAGIESFSGFVMSYVPGHACYCCLHGAQPQRRDKPIPVLGATAGVTGSMQAAECIKLLLDAGQPLIDRALYFNLLYHDYDIVEVRRNPECPVCGE